MSLDLMARRKDLSDDVAYFLQQQKQRQARLETTMRSFPSRGDMDMEKLEAKKKKNIHEVSSSSWISRDPTRDERAVELSIKHLGGQSLQFDLIKASDLDA